MGKQIHFSRAGYLVLYGIHGPESLNLAHRARPLPLPQDRFILAEPRFVVAPSNGFFLVKMSPDQATALDIPLAVEDSGLKAVDALVLQLVSMRPAPHPSGYWLTTVDEEMAVPYMTPQVSNSIVKLKAMGTSIFPALVKHLKDDRYSYSDIVEAWLNFTVRDAVVQVLDDGHYMHSGYKSRPTPSGSGGMYLSFDGYLRARGAEAWAEWAKSKSRLDVQTDFIDWCIKSENERSYVDEAQKKQILENYERARRSVRKEYSEPAGPPSGTLPVVH
jgi:hypothetical protein